IKVLVALAEVDQVRVLYILCEAFKERRDLEVKRAAALAPLALVPQRSGPSPSPPERPAQDPGLEGGPRDRDELSSGRVTRWPSGPPGTRRNADDPGHRVRSAEGPDGERRGRMSSLRTGAVGDGLIRPGPGVPTVMPGSECACPTGPPPARRRRRND